MLSKRERTIVIVTSIALAALGLNWYVIDPLMAARTELDARATRLDEQKKNNATLFYREEKAYRRWAEMKNAGMMTTPGEAETQLLQSMRDWAADARVNLASLKPERLNDKGELREIIVAASVSGPMKSIARFMYAIESAKIPVRVKRFSLDRRNEKSEELALEVQVSTLYRSKTDEKPASKGRGA
jgi:Tfp pilus assembly protein PilO